MLERPIIAITMGEPAGIGPEVIVKALARKEIYEKCIPIVIGDAAPIEDAIGICKSPLAINSLTDIKESNGEYGKLDLFPLGLLKKGDWEYKKSSMAGGEASFQYVIKGIALAMDKQVSAIVTAPINKESIHMAGHRYAGHTEILAEYTGTKDYAMLLSSKTFNVIHVSTHVSLREACDRVKKERVLRVIEFANRGMSELGYKNPKIGVAGLNPHSSENGLFGWEEMEEIIPAIEEARAKGIDAEGPIAPDTVFVKAQAGVYDVIVAMYHDQGHIPLKLSGFVMNSETGLYDSVSGINCTIGLPIVRTSVDHGTAYGKAGEGRANEESMVDAIEAAVRMAENKRQDGK